VWIGPSVRGSNVISGSETRLRLGVAQCTEVLADVPTYFYSLNGRASSGFSDLVVPIKRELPLPFGFTNLSVGYFDGVRPGGPFQLHKERQCESAPDVRESHPARPQVCKGVCGIGLNYWLGWVGAYNPDPNGLQRALQMAQQAIALDDSCPLRTAHWPESMRGRGSMIRR
jgi:hypothetical protein